MARLLGGAALLLVLLFFAVRAHTRLVPSVGDAAVVVESRWAKGRRLARRVHRSGDPGPVVKTDDAAAVVVLERVVAVGPMPSWRSAFDMALVPGKDGVRADLDGKTAFATPDDLLQAKVYEAATSFFDPSLTIGTHRAVLLALLARDLGTTAQDVAARASLARVRFERAVSRAGGPPKPLGADAIPLGVPLDRASVVRSVRSAAHHLARAVGSEGRFRYLVDATDNHEPPGYSWPRHAGATFFLAQAAGVLDDAFVRHAALRAASFLRETMVACGESRCVASTNEADVGSSALALVAFTELVLRDHDRSYLPAIRELAGFLRAQQRPDGEMMHVYKRAERRAVDVQHLYFTGEAALALARAHRVTEDPRDLDAAQRALAHLARHSWSFFGSRYYVSEEHWTCQAASELWDRAPDEEARTFCLRWHEIQGRLQYADGEAPFDVDGSYGVGPVLSPRTTPAASRGEALGATLALLGAERRDGRLAPEEAVLRTQLDRAVGFLLRHQLEDDQAPTYLFAEPELAVGAFPQSDFDPVLRIDYTQHAGSALVRWLLLDAPQAERAAPP